MNKAELVSAMAEEAQLTKVDAETSLKGILDALTDCLAGGAS